MTYELHPLCTLYPRMTGEPFELLKSDIAANGLIQPITLKDGMILDGGNRYRACQELGLEPRFVEFPGGSAVAFVRSMNEHRRHLTPGQNAVIVASMQDWEQANVQGRNTVTGNVAGDTIADRMTKSGASDRTQRMADKLAKADPELAMKVAHGEISLNKALRQLEPETKTPPPPPPIDYSKEPLVSAWVLCTRAKTAIMQIESIDPNAIAAIESIQLALTRRLEVITKCSPRK